MVDGLNCFFCGGPYHPASGAWYSERVQVCGPCVRHFYHWFRGFSKPRGKRETYTDFYGEHNGAAEGVGPWKKC